MNRLTEKELETLYKAGILNVTYTDNGITDDTVTRLLTNDTGGHFTLRCNYVNDNSIEIVSIERSKTIRLTKRV